MPQPSILSLIVPGLTKSAASREELIARGSCCGEKCRSCPYDPKHVKGSTKIRPREEDEIKPDEAVASLGPVTAPAGVPGSALLKGAMLKVARPNDEFIPDPNGARNEDGSIQYVENPDYNPAFDSYGNEREAPGFFERRNEWGKDIANAANKTVNFGGDVGRFYGDIQAWRNPARLPIELMQGIFNGGTDLLMNKDYYWNKMTGKYQNLPRQNQLKPYFHQQAPGQHWEMPKKWIPGDNFFSNAANAAISPFTGFANSMINIPHDLVATGRRLADPQQGQQNTFSDTGRWTTDPTAPYELRPEYKPNRQTFNRGEYAPGQFVPNSHDQPLSPQDRQKADEFFEKVRNAGQQRQQAAPATQPLAAPTKPGNPQVNPVKPISPPKPVAVNPSVSPLKKVSSTAKTPFLTSMVDAFKPFEGRGLDLRAPAYAGGQGNFFKRLLLGDYGAPAPTPGLIPATANVASFPVTGLIGPLVSRFVTPAIGATVDKLRGNNPSWFNAYHTYGAPWQTPIGQRTLGEDAFPVPAPPAPDASATRHAWYEVTAPWRGIYNQVVNQARLATRNQ